MTMMRQGGLLPEDEDRVIRRAATLERWVADLYGGTLREPYDPVGDVDLPGVGPVDVKSVPTPDVGFVNGGRRCPVVLAVVASETPRLILGLVLPEQWTLGLPDVPGRKAQRCWHVRRADVFPPTGSWVRLGCVRPEWYAMSEDDLLHTDWNDRNRRRDERADNAPLPMPWADPESVKRGTGLASRKGHAPGRTNWKRRRP